MSLRVEPLTEFTDVRGTLRKVHPAPVGGEVYVVTAAPGCSRGHHRHDRMGEWFVLLSGEGILGAIDPEGQSHHLDLHGVRVYVPAGWAHALFNTGDEAMLVVAMAERLHDPDDVSPVQVPPP